MWIRRREKFLCFIAEVLHISKKSTTFAGVFDKIKGVSFKKNKQEKNIDKSNTSSKEIKQKNNFFS